MHDEDLMPELCDARLARFHNRTTWPEKILGGLAGAGLIIMLLVALGGCGQQTSTPVAQQTDQMAATPVATDQNAASQGSQVNVWLLNTTADGGLPNPDAIKIEAADYASVASEGQSTGTGNASKDAKGGYVISGVTINVTTGDTTPSLTGTATGTGSASQSPAQTVSAYPTQDIRPELTASMPIAVPINGSIANPQAVTTGRGQTSDTGMTSESQAIYTQVKAMQDQLGKILEQLKTSATPPAPGPGGETPPPIPPTDPASTEPTEPNPANGG